MIDEKFLESLPDDPILAVHGICEEFFLQDNQIPLGHENECYENYLEVIGLFQAFSEAYQLDYSLPSLSGDRETNITRIRNFFVEVHKTLEKDVASLTIERARNRFSSKIGRAFSYEFTTGDLNRVQALLNELRDNVTKSKLFEEEHRQRILKRLELLQGELHKRMSNIDRLWGLVGEAGVVIGKFGNNAKPFVKLITEISEIAWRTQAKSEELPTDAPMPLLGNNEDKND